MYLLIVVQSPSHVQLCDPMDCSTPGLPVPHHLLEFPKFISIELVMPSTHLILCRPLLLLPSVFPSVRIFSNESADAYLRISMTHILRYADDTTLMAESEKEVKSLLLRIKE